jgi:hypothetical protein
MSAADWMVIRTRDGYRSVPRRVGLGMISRGAGEATTAGAEQALPLEPPEPHNDEYQDTGLRLQDEGIYALGAAVPDGGEDLDDDEDDPLDSTADATFKAVRGPVEYHPEALAAGLPPEPRGNAARKEWAAYATEHLGIEVTDAMNRNQIRDAAQEQLQSIARLPQPALTGGRLETPEDEPVTEESVTDDEDPGTR